MSPDSEEGKGRERAGIRCRGLGFRVHDEGIGSKEQAGMLRDSGAWERE
jgi:hypothetical protein